MSHPAPVYRSTIIYTPQTVPVVSAPKIKPVSRAFFSWQCRCKRKSYNPNIIIQITPCVCVCINSSSLCVHASLLRWRRNRRLYGLISPLPTKVNGIRSRVDYNNSNNIVYTLELSCATRWGEEPAVDVTLIVDNNSNIPRPVPEEEDSLPTRRAPSFKSRSSSFFFFFFLTNFVHLTF